MACLYNCQTCTEANSCENCDSGMNREKVGDVCECIVKFYDDSPNELCLACDYTCLTCQSNG